MIRKLHERRSRKKLDASQESQAVHSSSMSNRNLAIASTVLVFVCLSCQPLPRGVQAVPANTPHTANTSENRSITGTYGAPSTVATIRSPSVVESSGLVASHNAPGVYWTHNDSGDGPFIYAFDSRGESRGVWRVVGAKADDWEDISVGPGGVPGRPYLYIGDIGDNNASRLEIVVYRTSEPVIVAADTTSTKTKPRLTEPADAIRLRYPDGKHDAEALLVDPASGNIYIVTKIAFAKPSVYEAVAPLNATEVTTMKRVGDIRVPSLFGGVITGGSVSPDGRRVALCDYFEGYELVLPKGRPNFEDIWKQRMTTIDLGKRKQGEAIAYRLDGKALLTTSEGKRSPLIQVVRR